MARRGKVARIVPHWTRHYDGKVQALRRGVSHSDKANGARVDLAIARFMRDKALRVPAVPPKVRDRQGRVPTHLYRGVKMTPEFVKKLQLHKYLDDRGYMAFSWDPAVAAGFSEGPRGMVSVVFEVAIADIPRGTPWIWFGSDKDVNHVRSSFSTEAEVLLPPGRLVVKAFEVERQVRGIDGKIPVLFAKSLFVPDRQAAPVVGGEAIAGFRGGARSSVSPAVRGVNWSGSGVPRQHTLPRERSLRRDRVPAQDSARRRSERLAGKGWLDFEFPTLPEEVPRSSYSPPSRGKPRSPSYSLPPSPRPRSSYSPSSRGKTRSSSYSLPPSPRPRSSYSPSSSYSLPPSPLRKPYSKPRSSSWKTVSSSYSLPRPRSSYSPSPLRKPYSSRKTVSSSYSLPPSPRPRSLYSPSPSPSQTTAASSKKFAKLLNRIAVEKKQKWWKKMFR